MNIKTFIYSPNSKYILAIVLGFGLSTLFRKACNNRNCLMFKGAKNEDIHNKIFKYNDKCYKYKTTASSCDTNKKIIDFA